MCSPCRCVSFRGSIISPPLHVSSLPLCGCAGDVAAMTNYIEVTITDPDRQFRHLLHLSLVGKCAALGECTRSGDTVTLSFLHDARVMHAVAEAISECRDGSAGFRATPIRVRRLPWRDANVWSYERGDDSPPRFSIAECTRPPAVLAHSPSDSTSVPSRVQKAHIIPRKAYAPHVVYVTDSGSGDLYCGIATDILNLERCWTLGMEPHAHTMFDRYDFFVTWAVHGPQVVLLPVIVNTSPEVLSAIVRWYISCHLESALHRENLIRALVVRKYMTFAAKGIVPKEGDRWVGAVHDTSRCPWYPAAPLLHGPPAGNLQCTAMEE